MGDPFANRRLERRWTIGVRDAFKGRIGMQDRRASKKIVRSRARGYIKGQLTPDARLSLRPGTDTAAAWRRVPKETDEVADREGHPIPLGGWPALNVLSEDILLSGGV